jgi:hypothetical protein
MLAPVTAMRHVGLALALGASLAGGSAGCSAHHDVEAAPRPDALAPTPLTIANGTHLDYVIYVDHDGEMSRVATVTAASRVRYLIPSWMTQNSHLVRLFAHSIGSTGSLHPSDGTLNTEFIHILPGQYIEWRLEPNLGRSTVAVY